MSKEGSNMEAGECGKINKDFWKERMFFTIREGPKAHFKQFDENGIRRSFFNRNQIASEMWKSYGSLPENVRIYNQDKSARCWIYAALSVVETMIKKKGIDVCELSANYISFFDLFEKSNYFLQYIIGNMDVKADDRTFSQMLLSPVRDAGQWQFFCNIVIKYGLVPSKAMPDTKISSDSRELVDVLSDILREDAAYLFALHKKNNSCKKELVEAKQEMLEQILNLLISSYGNPPREFDLHKFTYNFPRGEKGNVTPEYFFEKCIGRDYLNRYVTVVNFPQNSKSYYEKYSVEWMGNVWGTSGGVYINVPENKLKEYVINQLDAGLPVWIGCDSMPYSDRFTGFYSTDNYRLKELGFRYAFLDKSKNLDFNLSRPRHAMVVRGYEPCKKLWLFQNSYGPDFGNKGFILVTDEWFSLYVYEAVIDSSYLDDDVSRCLEHDAKLLKPWDVLGTLA